jgi:hypothetical protein
MYVNMADRIRFRPSDTYLCKVLSNENYYEKSSVAVKEPFSGRVIYIMSMAKASMNGSQVL